MARPRNRDFCHVRAGEPERAILLVRVIAVTKLSVQTKGYLLAFVGVGIFALTLPVTRLIVNDTSTDAMSAAFVTACRAAIAGFCGLAYLWWQQSLRLPNGMLTAILICALGTVLAFPYFLGMGLSQAPSIQAAVVTEFMPICTAVFASLYFRQRQSWLFWFFALVGFLLILAFSIFQGLGAIRVADIFLVLAVVTGAVGYIAGIKLSSTMPASQAISWVLVLCLPITLPATIWLWPTQPVTASNAAALLYLGVFSMWLGFFAWYKGLVLGGAMRVSQVQLLQPFLALLFSALLLGEQLDHSVLLFAVALILTVFASKRVAR